MSPLVVLGARLVRAGGTLRIWSVIGGCALAVAVAATAWALPDALYPVTDPMTIDARRAPLVGLTRALVVPVLALVLTVGRLSSQARDRRLAALRMLGVPQQQVAVVALVENLLPATAGAVLGVGGHLALRAVLEAVLRDDLQAPVALAPVGVALVAAAVVAASALLAMTPLRNLGPEPRTAHAEAAVRTPSPWRLVPLPLAVAAFAYLLTRAPGTTHPSVTPIFLGGVVCGALGIALATPVVTSLLAARMVRSSRLTVLLAGRGMQTQPESIGRRVAALGLAVYVVVGGAGVLGIYEGTTHLTAAVTQVERGPQTILISPRYPDSDLAADLLAEIEGMAGVRAVVPSYFVTPQGCGGEHFEPVCGNEIIVADCADLSALMVAAGCRDDEVAWIESDITGYEDVVPPSGARPTALDLVDFDGRALGTHALTGTIVQDVPATADLWTWPATYSVFVPLGLAEEWGLPVLGATVVADAGTDVRTDVIAAAERRGTYAENPYLYDYLQVVSTRTAAWTVLAVGTGVALLAYGLATVDHALERRRSRARLVALGVPARLLRRVVAVQNTGPLLAATALAAVLGIGATAALSHYDGQGFALSPQVLAGIFAATTAGAIAVSLLATPLTRAAIRAEDLRDE